MSQTASEKSRDQHARRRLRRLGYTMWKVRPNAHPTDHDPYALVEDGEGTFVVTRSINEVETWLDEAEKSQEAPIKTP